MLRRIKQWMGEKLTSPRFRYNQAAYIQRALTLTHPRERVIEAALEFRAKNGVRGDYLEFGVFQGQSFIHAYAYNAYLTTLFEQEMVPILRGASSDVLTATRFIAFDSFVGMPTPGVHDTADGHDEWCAPGSFACTEDEFWARLQAAGIDLSRVTAVPGWFEDSLTQTVREQLDQAAVVHIDCDYYQPTLRALEFVSDLLTDGTVIIFDDWWNCYGRPDRSQQRAFHEWRRARPELQVTEFLRDMTASFIVHTSGAYERP